MNFHVSLVKISLLYVSDCPILIYEIWGASKKVMWWEYEKWLLGLIKKDYADLSKMNEKTS